MLTLASGKFADLRPTLSVHENVRNCVTDQTITVCQADVLNVLCVVQFIVRAQILKGF